MSIQEFATQLQDELSIGAQRDAFDFVATSKNIVTIRGAISRLKDFTRGYRFGSLDEEVLFFKNTKPVFISQLIYHQTLFRIQSGLSFNPMDSANICEMQLKKFEQFTLKHARFLQYCMSGDDRYDRLYFTRAANPPSHFNADESFTTGFDDILGRFLAYQLATEYIKNEYRIIDGEKFTAAAPLAWTDSKVSLIELAYALYASKALDNGNASVRQIITTLEQLTGLDLSNYRRIFADIRIRKTGPVNFLDRLSRQYVQYVEGLVD